MLAVSAPGSIELHQNFLILVEHNVPEVLSDHDLDWLIVGFGDGGRLEEGLNLSTVDIPNKSSKGLSSD
jgi:hypothetical protein